jgi:hypothetical protein
MAQDIGISAGGSGEIKDVGILDLTSSASEASLAAITRISDVGMVLIPERLQGAVVAIPMERVGQVTAIPDGPGVRISVGQLQLSGEALAAGGGDLEDTLVVVGQLVLTSRVERVGFRRLIVIGQIVAPRGSEPALAAGISKLVGQNAFYRDGARIFVGADRFGSRFVQLLPEGTTLVLVGAFAFEPDVAGDSLRQKVSEIILCGTISAARDLVPVLQFLTTQKAGTIEIEEAGTEGAANVQG